MGWFSRSTVAPSESPQQQDTFTAGSSLAQDGSTAPKSTVISPEAAAAVTQPRIDTQADTPTLGSSTTNTTATAARSPSFPAEVMEFDEYKTSDDVYARFKALDAFNQLMACSSLGSNIRNYYRYGTYRDCSDKYDHLKFCLSIKTKSPQVAQVMIQKHDAELKAKKQSEPNSEDVWTARMHPPEELVDLARQA